MEHVSNHKNDIANKADITQIISLFYEKLMIDPLVKHFFIDVRVIDLEEHIPVIVNFWDNIIFQTGAYKANAMHKHFELNDDSPITPAHFERWLALFYSSIDYQFSGPNANLAKERAAQVALLMQHKINALNS